ncbi:MAG: beta-hydroxyacyl-ACP dehydratase [Planctomycetes bacterium]|nr:beta-hydroxyacyl-ACP dehydratase [Planctomycetota bacterium]MCB9869938.1 beta-hydroxyacyl-ACP dehydratase [Planctomycetota bacterium]
MSREIVDLASLDLSSDVMTDAEIRAMVPHAHEFRLIDGVCHLDLQRGILVAYKDWDEDPWWARGHIPGRPIMPGVLMVEGCAQASTILMKKHEGWDANRFIGLGGLDRVRFRGQVTPPCRVHFVSEVGTQSGNRLAKYPAQCFLDGKMVMQMELLGVLL